jgi:hypothetical protein
MQKHDDDNIPVLDDIIYEHDVLHSGAPATNEKQKALWDEDGDEFAEAPEAVATPGEYARDEPEITLDSADTAGEIPDDTDALPTDEPVALLQHDEPVDTTNVTEATAYDAIQIEPDETAYDFSNHATQPPVIDSPPPQAEQIDIDALAQQVLSRLMPDLEDYLFDRIRDALQTALDDKTLD